MTKSRLFIGGAAYIIYVLLTVQSIFLATKYVSSGTDNLAATLSLAAINSALIGFLAGSRNLMLSLRKTNTQVLHNDKSAKHIGKVILSNMSAMNEIKIYAQIYTSKSHIKHVLSSLYFYVFSVFIFLVLVMCLAPVITIT